MSEIVYGRHPVNHLLTAGRRKVRQLHVQSGSEKDLKSLLELAKAKRVSIQIDEPRTFTKSLKPGSHHQGIYVETESYSYVPVDTFLSTSFLLVLDEIQDPQNLGAICRSAYLFGVEGVVLSENQSAGIGPGACQSSVGAVEHLKIGRVSSIANFLEILKKNNFWVYGADALAGKNNADEQFPNKVALVVGSEEKGLRRLVRERCDLLIQVPMKRGEVDSLNASVAAGILLYEVYRQKSSKK